MRRYISALALGITLTATAFPFAAQAGELKADHAHKIELRGVNGVAYYTVEAGRYHVVAVLAADETAAPVRFAATLEPGQSFTISVPGAVDQGAATIEIVRDGDAVRVAPAVVALN